VWFPSNFTDFSTAIAVFFTCFCAHVNIPQMTGELKFPANSKFCLECGTKIATLAADEVICPVCGKKVRKGKFCLECGASLINKCPVCGAEVAPGGKFCPECGTKL